MKKFALALLLATVRADDAETETADDTATDAVVKAALGEACDSSVLASGCVEGHRCQVGGTVTQYNEEQTAARELAAREACDLILDAANTVAQLAHDAAVKAAADYAAEVVKVTESTVLVEAHAVALAAQVAADGECGDLGASGTVPGATAEDAPVAACAKTLVDANDWVASTATPTVVFAFGDANGFKSGTMTDPVVGVEVTYVVKESATFPLARLLEFDSMVPLPASGDFNTLNANEQALYDTVNVDRYQAKADAGAAFATVYTDLQPDGPQSETDTADFTATTVGEAPTQYVANADLWYAATETNPAPVAPTEEKPGEYVKLTAESTIPEDCNVTAPAATEEAAEEPAEEPAAEEGEEEEAEETTETTTDAAASGPGACVAEADCSDTVVCGAKSLAAGALALLAAAATM